MQTRVVTATPATTTMTPTRMSAVITALDGATACADSSSVLTTSTTTSQQQQHRQQVQLRHSSMLTLNATMSLKCVT